MQFSHSDHDIFVPDGMEPQAALRRTTHLCLGAHQDDIEIFAYDGISECFGKKDKWFSGVVITNGAGSPRSGIYADYTDAEMMRVRIEEQRKAASIGDYAIQIQLAHPSSAVKDAKATDPRADLKKIFETAQAEVVYLHNPADKHDTHVACTLRCIEALRELPAEKRPKKVLGGEVWRSLDWLLDSDKQILDVSKYSNLAACLVGIFDSQVSGGKRYDLATAGRRLANATYFDSHATDDSNALAWAMDLTPLVADDALDIADYTLGFIDRLRDDVKDKLAKFS